MTAIIESTRRYEAWLRGRFGADIVEADLERKYRRMKSGGFAFLRATYWRWAETILDVCPPLASAPAVLAIGDTHLENFGTWRDAEGRLVWGANDFDDAATMPYALDLVRLATSALLARAGDAPSSRAIGEAILGGYRRGLASPAPVILERDFKWLRNTVLLSNSGRKLFWDKFDALPAAIAPVPARYVDALAQSLPDLATSFAARPRTAGTGSLGRPRFVAIVEWRGGPVLREAKGMAQSAWSLRHAPADVAVHAGTIAAGRARSPDPHYQLLDNVLVRRLSPNSRKIEVDGDTKTLLSREMLDLMGFEIANCHADDASRIPPVLADLDRRGTEWLRTAAKAAAARVVAEQNEFAAAW